MEVHLKISTTSVAINIETIFHKILFHSKKYVQLWMLLGSGNRMKAYKLAKEMVMQTVFKQYFKKLLYHYLTFFYSRCHR